MAWLLREGEVLASLTIAEDMRSRARGLMRRDDFEGALLLRPAMSVHTVGMRFAIDVAYCDSELRVIDVACMRPFRVGRPRLRSRAVIEAEAGSFERWGLHVGDELEIE